MFSLFVFTVSRVFVPAPMVLPLRASWGVPFVRGTARTSLGTGTGSTVGRMDNRADVREFLTSRRARVTPDVAGLPSGTNRRVPGLRRTEVAMLAGVSVEYYTKLERGAISGASPEVLDALARALRLDEAERSHLFDLAHAAGPVARPPRRRPASTWAPHPSLQWVLDSITAGPAFVRNGRLDIVAVNLLARAFYKDVADSSGRPPNLARFNFLDERSRDFYPDWDMFADITVAILRTEAGRDPHNKELHDLIGELSTRSAEFRTKWGAHDVRHHGAGFKTFHHDIVGEMTLAYEGMDLESEPGLTMTVYAAEPGTPSADRLAVLASWAASEYGERPGAHTSFTAVSGRGDRA